MGSLPTHRYWKWGQGEPSDKCLASQLKGFKDQEIPAWGWITTVPMGFSDTLGKVAEAVLLEGFRPNENPRHRDKSAVFSDDTFVHSL